MLKLLSSHFTPSDFRRVSSIAGEAIATYRVYSLKLITLPFTPTTSRKMHECRSLQGWAGYTVASFPATQRIVSILWMNDEVGFSTMDEWYNRVNFVADWIDFVDHWVNITAIWRRAHSISCISSFETNSPDYLEKNNFYGANNNTFWFAYRPYITRLAATDQP